MTPSPTPVVQFSPPTQMQNPGQSPQGPGSMGRSQGPSWGSMGPPMQTPLSSRGGEPRLYSSPVATTPPHGPGMMHSRPYSTPTQQHTTPPGNPGPSTTAPSPRLDTSAYNMNRSMPMSNVPGQHTISPVVQGAPLPFAVSDQELLAYTMRILDRLMNNELRTPSLYNSLVSGPDAHMVQSLGLKPISGFMDQDYPPVVQQHIVTEKQFTVAHSAPIPPELNELLRQGEPKTCHMGLFPEIYRAWMTIDSDLYLWDFRDGSDLSFYDGLKEPIITMALIQAKTNVFLSSIQHLLCVSTASEIVILGFIVTDPSLPMSPTSQVLELVPQPIFVISTDNARFVVVHGTKSGRIFLGATNGSIHEVNYQAGRGWFQDRCWKKDLSSGYLSSFFNFINRVSHGDAIVQIVSDDERNILYTRSDSGAIYAYDLGADGCGFKCIGSMSLEGVVNEVIKVSKKTLEANLVKKILTISPIKTGELCLVAILESGVRLYFTCYEPVARSLNRDIRPSPNVFNLVHIRLPPGHCPGTTVHKPSASHLAYYSAGVFALATHGTQDQDRLWLLSPLLYPTQCHSELYYVHRLPGKAVAIDMIPNADYDLSLQNMPDIVTQHLKWNKQIVVLTSSGSLILRASKPFEILKRTLIEANGPENIKGHFELGLGRELPLSNSLLLAIHPFERVDQAIYDMVVRALFLYGGTDSGNSSHHQSFEAGRSPHERSLEFNPNLVSTPRQESSSPHYPSNDATGYVSPPIAGSGFPHQGVNPQMYGMQQPMSTVQENYYPTCSPRHDAIYLLVGRILYEFWHRPLVKAEFSEGPGSVKTLFPNVQGDEVTYATAFLHSILVFLNENPSLCMVRTTVASGFGNVNVQEGRHIQQGSEFERNSLIALKNFLNITMEVLGMWKILCDHKFSIVLQGLDERLIQTTMRNLIVDGENTVSVIINALISKYLGDNAAVDAISLRLREVCPTLFKNEDAIGSKVAEILSKVKHVTDPTEREALLKESLVLAEKISGHRSINIQNFCRQYGELGFPVGAVRLVVSCAKASDPDQLALNVVKATASNNDAASIRAFQTRTEIYKVVFEMLDRYVNLATSTYSQVPLNKDDTLHPARAQNLADEAIHAILSSDDEAFHFTLYNWLLERKLFDRLLEIKHGFLDAFLQRAADAVTTGKWPGGGNPANDTRVLDLLWRHHEMNNNHSAAAQILSKLAESTTTGLNLQQRLEYMSRAIICCKSTSRRGDLLEMLEDKLDVARIQKSILDAINVRISSISSNSSMDAISPELKGLEDAIEKLNSQLMNITQLYGEFAHPLKLHEAKLEIFHAAGHSDRKVIETVWSDIIEAELGSISRRPPEVQMDLLRRRLVAIGKKYVGSPSFFPIEFLIEHLESMKPQDSEDVGWAFTIMIDVGVTFWDVLCIYERLWKRLNGSENTTVEEIQIAKVIIFMIDLFARNEIDIRNVYHIRLELLEKCKQLIALMMVEFSGRTDDSKDIKLQLNRVQDRLDRCR